MIQTTFYLYHLFIYKNLVAVEKIPVFNSLPVTLCLKIEILTKPEMEMKNKTNNSRGLVVSVQPHISDKCSGYFHYQLCGPIKQISSVANSKKPGTI